jgi:UDP-N-acetylmuramoyl-tripeptide--D-alanyl-D-alanine ligase
MQALTALGQAARARSRARHAAITGSVGKTGTKEALRLALSAQAPTHASAASHNNHWGVPLSLARQPRAAAYGVYELGMNAPGEIAALAGLVRPQVAMITAVAPAHLGFFPSVAAIAAAKGEIFGGLEPDGVAVLNRDDPHFTQLARLAAAAGCDRVIGFGAAPDAVARLRDARLDPSGSDVLMALDGVEIAYRIGAPGRHWVTNSLGVIACAAALGADPAAAAAALAGFRPPKGRGQRHRLRRRGGEITLIDESYNANPASMRSALGAMATVPRERFPRRIAVLGDMLELGANAGPLHEGVKEAVDAAEVDLVFACGTHMQRLFAALPAARRGEWAETSQGIVAPLLAAVRAGDVVMVKGSLGSRMAPLVDALMRRGEEDCMRLARHE